ncbi:MAG: FtsQ-type POTRA domain-containing protein [Chloroflexi bacterium]|nr:FtsQ-type POTRA domain-containing protein [Chloroflexota bacterium]
MPIYRSSPSRKKSKSKRKRRKSRRFSHPSVAVFDPRRLLPDTPKTRAPARRPARKRRRSLLKHLTANWNSSHLFALLLFLTALTAIGYSFIDLQFYVYSAEIENNRYTADRDIIIKSGIYADSIFFVNPKEVAQKLSQLPHVQKATVEVGLPARVRIHLQEWEPVLIYQIQQNQRFWISEEGRVAPEAESRPELVRLIDDDQAVAIDDLHLNPDVVKAILRIHGALPEVKVFRYEAQRGLWFVSPEDWNVFFGPPTDMENKLILWEAIRKRLLQEERQVKLIDLRPKNPYWH